MNIKRSRTIGIWLIRDTVRQAVSSGVFWVLLGLCAVSILVCLSMRVEGPTTALIDDSSDDFLPRHDQDALDKAKVDSSGVPVAGGQLTLAFGAIRVPIARDTRSAVHFVQLILAGGVADTLGLLLAIVWTAGFVPSFLEAGAISVLLAKPAPRWMLLLGKYIGVVLFIGLYAVVFVGGTWAAIGVRTGMWDSSYLLCIPLLLLHFAIFYSVSLLLGVLVRSTVLCVFGSTVFWAIAWGVNYGRHAIAAMAAISSEAEISSPVTVLSEAAYWMLPKPMDFGMLLSDVLGASSDFASASGTALGSSGPSMVLSLLSSTAFALVVLFSATRVLERADY